MPSILISCAKLADYAGSEITTLELAEEFIQRGWAVHVASFFVNPIIKEQLLNLGAEFIDLRSEHPFQYRSSFDFAWIHHNVCAYRICLDKDVQISHAIFSSLSHFEITEQLPAAAIDFSCYIAHSLENYRHILKKHPWVAKKLLLSPNSAPKSWWASTEFSTVPTLLQPQKLAVISNHMPEEISSARKILQEVHHIDVVHYGLGGVIARITPNILLEFDAIITIGKTVQYALASGIPVYCYDHFGGPGWITPENLEESLEVNFSGRGQSKRTDQIIVSEIIEGFTAARNNARSLHHIAGSLFSLTKNVDTILSQANSPFTINLNSTDDISFYLMELSKVFSNQINIGENMRFSHSESENSLRAIIRSREASLDLRLQEITALGQRLNDSRSDWHAIKAQLDALTIERDHLQNLIATKESQFTQVVNELSAIKATKSYRVLLPARNLWSAILRLLRKPATPSLPQQVTIDQPEAKLIEEATTSEDMPLVSVIIPVYDRTDVLKIAIDSILAQSYPKLELIIITDGSPSETLEVLHPYRNHQKVRIYDFSWSSGNAVRGRNKGILESRGDFIAFLDSDDVASPDRISLSVQAMLDHGVDVIYGSWQAIIDGSRAIDNIQDGQIIQSPDADYEDLKKACIPCQSTVMVRKSALLTAGLLKPEMKYREDHELWARLAYFGFKFKSIPYVLTNLRLHAGNNELNFKNDDDSWYTKLIECHTVAGPIPKKIAFILPGVDISGGVAVIFRHAIMLAEAGHDVLIINVGMEGDGLWYSSKLPPIYSIANHTNDALKNIDILFATGWQTAEWLHKISSRRKIYFVQSDERRFFDDDNLKKHIENTYKTECEYITEAHWIAKFLKEEFGHVAQYVPNGLDTDVFYPGTPLQEKTKKPRVLLEGPLIIPFKGMADAYAAVSELDCEIWLVSSAGAPPKSWKIDRFFEGVSFEKMRSIYASCDVFLKMSRVEGFFGPPMEAMACGCAVVVGEVTGYEEYIIHNHNALVVKQGDVHGASNAVQSLILDISLRNHLIENGYKTAASWTWKQSHQAMLEVVNG